VRAPGPFSTLGGKWSRQAGPSAWSGERWLKKEKEVLSSIGGKGSSTNSLLKRKISFEDTEKMKRGPSWREEACQKEIISAREGEDEREKEEQEGLSA